VYSNGSQDELGNTGWGAVTFYKARATKAKGCLPNAEVYNAEAVMAHKAIKLAREQIQADPDIKEIILFLDNSAVVNGILGKTPHSLQRAYMGLRKIAKDLQPRIRTKIAPRHRLNTGHRLTQIQFFFPLFLITRSERGL
jgi:ribonuclease HI